MLAIIYINIYILIPWLVTGLIRKRFSSIIKRNGCICLTFDDGPDPGSTPQILELLNTAGTKATFFLLGENAEKYPDIVRKIVDTGHEIGDHSYRHTHAWKCNPFQSVVDLIRGGRTIEKYRKSKEPILFRPPYGKLNLATLMYTFFARKRMAFWNVDPKDYQQHSGKIVADYVIERISRGSVILLHDGRRNMASSPDVTVSGVRLILEAVIGKGLTLNTLSEAITGNS